MSVSSDRERTMSVKTQRSNTDYISLVEWVTIRGRGIFIEIKLQIVHFVFRALIICKILSQNRTRLVRLIQVCDNNCSLRCICAS